MLKQKIKQKHVLLKQNRLFLIRFSVLKHVLTYTLEQG